MDFDFIKKVSRALMIIGLVTLFFNSLIFLQVGSDLLISYATFIGIAISTIVMAIGVNRPSRGIAYFQIIGTYLIVFFAFLDKPDNLAGIFLAIVNYLLLIEYKVLLKTWHKIIIISLYIMPQFLSIMLLKRSIEELPPTYLLVAFFCFFLYTYFHNKKEKDWNLIDKSIKVIAHLEPITEELVAISKRQDALITEQAAQIEEYKKSSVAS